MNVTGTETSVLTFERVYSHPGDMEGVSAEFYSLFRRTAEFLLPIETDSDSGLGWVLLELLNNAVRAPVSIAMNSNKCDINEINFYSTIIIRKTVYEPDQDGNRRVEISVMNSGENVEAIMASIEEILSGSMSIFNCEERFMLKGSYTGNGGMGILLSQKQVRNGLHGDLTFRWHEGFYDFTIIFNDRN